MAIWTGCESKGACNNGSQAVLQHCCPQVRFKATENREWSLRRSCAGRHGVKYRQNGADPNTRHRRRYIWHIQNRFTLRHSYVLKPKSKGGKPVGQHWQSLNHRIWRTPLTSRTKSSIPFDSQSVHIAILSTCFKCYFVYL
jgi:hypothetical protein